MTHTTHLMSALGQKRWANSGHRFFHPKSEIAAPEGLNGEH